MLLVASLSEHPCLYPIPSSPEQEFGPQCAIVTLLSMREDVNENKKAGLRIANTQERRLSKHLLPGVMKIQNSPYPTD